ncbi:MAG: hypothetical protein JW827_10625 [Spirochaetes bacterium]|nr:hypothetical protein [Spirochaetota bacterium]
MIKRYFGLLFLITGMIILAPVSFIITLPVSIGGPFNLSPLFWSWPLIVISMILILSGFFLSRFSLKVNKRVAVITGCMLLIVLVRNYLTVPPQEGKDPGLYPASLECYLTVGVLAVIFLLGALILSVIQKRVT